MSYCLPKKKIKIEQEYADNADWIKSIPVSRPQTLEQYLETKKVEQRLVKLVELFRIIQRKGSKYKDKRKIKKLFEIARIKLNEIQNYFKPVVRYRKISRSKRGRPTNRDYDEMSNIIFDQQGNPISTKYNSPVYIGSPCIRHPTNKYCIRYKHYHMCVRALYEHNTGNLIRQERRNADQQ